MFDKFEVNKFGRTSFEIKDLDVSLVNALRRIILTDIPVVGFDGEIHPSLKVITNTGPLHNEIMLHRLGLIPIHFSDEETETFNSDEYEFILNMTNNNATTKNVTSNDIQIKRNDKLLSSSEALKLFPQNSITKDFILITKLRTGETFHVEGKAIKSTARHHAGFSPVSLCTFFNVQNPVESAKVTDILNKERAYYKNEYGDCTLFKFEIETETGLSVKYLVSKAISILTDKVNNIITNISSIKIQPAENEIGYEFIFENEDDTLGSFLQSHMHNHYIRNQNLTSINNRVSYVGYSCPHPLDTTMILKICIKNEKDESFSKNEQDYKDVLIEQCRRLLVHLQEISNEWNSFAK